MSTKDPAENSIEYVTTFGDSSDFLNGEISAAATESNGSDSETSPSAAAQEAPRPIFNISEAAAILGKSVRALERSLLGRWGNKLPEGWAAKKVRTEKGEEWRLTPPAGFRLRGGSYTPQDTQSSFEMPDLTEFLRGTAESSGKRSLARSEHNYDQPTIVIDRSEEVEHLLRELLSTQKTLSEERRLHMEDLRIISQMQGSMRLLESSASESARAKSDLELTRKELEELKREYNLVLNMPWWKRIFGFNRS